MRKPTKWILFLLFTISFSLGVLLNWFYSPLPTYSGEITLPTIQKEVEVYTDTYGVPHIFAENEKDLFFVAGYIAARERLFQLSMVALAVKGELASILGDSYRGKSDFKAVLKDLQLCPRVKSESCQLCPSRRRTEVEKMVLPRMFILPSFRSRFTSTTSSRQRRTNAWFVMQLPPWKFHGTSGRKRSKHDKRWSQSLWMIFPALVA